MINPRQTQTKISENNIVPIHSVQYLSSHTRNSVVRYDRQSLQNNITDTVLKQQVKSTAQTTSKMSFDNDRYGGGRAVSDALIAPAKFGGASSEDAESFIRHVVRYFDYKRLSDKERVDIPHYMANE